MFVTIQTKNGGTMTAWYHTLTNKDGQTALVDCDDFAAGIVQSALQEFLEAEMDVHLGAGRYERSDGRTGHRNGHRDRPCASRWAA